QLYSLQKGLPAEQISQVAKSMKVIDVGSELQDMADTAAVMKSLDLIISVDTAPVHLAGALGREVWTLLAYSADWRWMMGREQTPWYPTMRLFRQTQLDQWDDVMARVTANVASSIKLRATGARPAD